MTDRWFAGDLHLGHKRLVEGFEEGSRGPRGHFASIEEHDEAIIERWNSVVKPGDKAYLLGDVALSKTGLTKVPHLNGKLRIVLGNHDQEKASHYDAFFERVYGAKCLDGMILTHIPLHPSCLTRRSMQVNLHAHLHDEVVTWAVNHERYLIGEEDPIVTVVEQPDPRYQCISLEHTNFTPKHYDEVMRDFGGMIK
jgi:calcineurin-like phosphoesterase family protein